MSVVERPTTHLASYSSLQVVGFHVLQYQNGTQLVHMRAQATERPLTRADEADARDMTPKGNSEICC